MCPDMKLVLLYDLHDEDILLLVITFILLINTVIMFILSPKRQDPGRYI